MPWFKLIFKMKKIILTISLALTVSAVFAGDAYDYRSNGKCPPNASRLNGSNGVQLYGIWQCRPLVANRLNRRYFDVYYSFLDPVKYAGKLINFDPALAAWKSGNTWGAQDLAEKLIDTPYTDSLFAETKKIAFAAIKPKLIAVNVTFADGKTCACDVKNQNIGGILYCPREIDQLGALFPCHGQ